MSANMLANPTYYKPKRSDRTPLVLLSVILLLTLVVGLVCSWLMLQTVTAYYAARIYPSVYVQGIKLGRMSPEEATTILGDAASHLDSTTGLLTLSDGEHYWSVSWTEAGMHLDVSASVQAAFAVGHADQRPLEQVRVWLRRHDVAPVFTVDPAQAREMLVRLAPSVAIPSTEATLRLEGDQVVTVQGQPGRELDVDATLVQLLAAANGRAYGARVGLVFQVLAPRVVDAAPLQAQAEEMLSRQIELSTYDVLSGETFGWTLGRWDIVNWLRVERSTVRVDQEAVRATLADLAATLGQGRGLRLEEATEGVLNTFEAGGGAINLYLTHSPRTHIVQSGDTVSSIAAAFGMPVWLVLQANPDIDVNWLQVGQELVIPSQDLLTPHLPVRGKRVVVSVAEQRVRAYQEGAVVFDWLVSTGIADSPTNTGIFQVLSHEENAYASLWDLWMPHFVAIYPAGPDFHNGFHGLPTLSSGRRLWGGLLGSPVSYGCIILGLEEAETFYHWAEVGVVVVVE